jgi:hypothetical protein
MTLALSPETGTMTQLLQGSPWEVGAYRRALALKDLRDDWDRPQSQRPTIEAINGALRYIELVAGLEFFVIDAPFIAPLSNGGVQLEWDRGQRQLEIEVLPDGSAQFLISDAGEIREGALNAPTSPSVKALLGWLAASP